MSRTNNRPGLYVIADITTGQSYVGSTTNLDRRTREHKHALEIRKHHNWKLSQAYREGHELFMIQCPTETDKTIEELREMEQQLLDEFYPQNCLMNIASNTDGPGMVFLGRKHSEETKTKLKNIAVEQNRKPSRKTVEAARSSNIGRKHSEETRAKVATASKTRMTPEAREHLSQVNIGIKHTPEDIEKMRNIKRENSGRRVIVDGEEFRSITEVTAKYGATDATVRRRCNSADDKFKDWSFKYTTTSGG